jgi:hypothetical protein
MTPHESALVEQDAGIIRALFGPGISFFEFFSALNLLGFRPDKVKSSGRCQTKTPPETGGAFGNAK